jgi:Kef-type K+ transport system membrane component KefB
MRRDLFGLGMLQILISGVLISAYAWLFNLRLAVACVVGFGLAMSSTAMGLQTLAEKGDVGSRYGRAAFAILLMQDMAIVPLLAVTPLFGNIPGAEDESFGLRAFLVGGGVVGIMLAVRFVLRPVLHLLARGRNSEIFAGASVLAVLSAAWLMEYVGVSMALGAFLVGLLLSDSEYRHRIEAEVEPFRGFLLGLFFMAIGMSIDFGFFAQEGLMMLGHLTGMLLIKSMVLFGVCLAFRHTLADAL